MGLSAVITAASSGLNAYQIATDVTAENIANVNTAGYSRQTVQLENAPPTTHDGYPLGSGVQVASITRYYDSLMQQQLVNAGTSQGYDTQKSTVLQQVEPTFNEVANDGLGAAISNFFGAWQDVTLNPGGTSERQVVMTRAQILTDNFHSVSKSLTDAAATQNSSLVPLTDSINSTLTNIAQLNQQIKGAATVSGSANEIKDQRDQLVSDLSQKLGFKYTENSDGTTDIYLAKGNTNYYLVKGADAGSLSVASAPPSGNYTVTAHDAYGSTTTIDNSVYSGQDGGQLWATLQMRDTIIPGYLSQVDTLAKSVTDAVNTQHAAGFTPTGATGQDFFTASATVDGSAARFSIAAGLTTATIAASGSAGTPGDNSNALAMVQLTSSLTVPSGSATSTFSSFYSNLVSQVGLDVQASKTVVTQDAAFTKQLTTLRDSNSGVSLDQELSNLMKYQRSYQASAKVLTTATDMMDMALSLIR